MKNKDLNFDIKSLTAKLPIYLAKLSHYTVLAFVVFLVGLYAFMVLRITNLYDAEPTSDQVVKQVKAIKVPRIDEQVVKQLQSLQDNSVSVKSLFDEARNNPFFQ